MQILFQCPSCQHSRREVVAADSGAITCEGCRWTRAIRAGDLEGNLPQKCLVCGCDDLWRQKDFPQRLGVAIVALAALVSTIAFALYMPLTALGVLLAAALIDMLLFALMPDVLVCYRCAARYRDVGIHEDHPRFNLETAERYRQEAARVEQSRHTAGSAP
jgi:hypothetical protein